MKRQKRQRRTRGRRRPSLEALESRRVLAAISVSIEAPELISESGSQTLRYTVSRDDTTFPMAVQFGLSGDAVYEVDYQVREGDRDTIRLPESASEDGTVRGTVIFEAGVDSIDVVVDPMNDGVTELDESVILTVFQSDTFGSIGGAATRFVEDMPADYFVVDQNNQLGKVDVVRGVIERVGFIDVFQQITDLAFTSTGDLYAISRDNLYQIELDAVTDAVSQTVFLGGHSVLNANALVDARDGDFGSTEGDLFIAGLSTLDLYLIDLETLDDTTQVNNVFPVFDIAQALADRAFESDYLSSGDLDYRTGGELLLSAMRMEDDSDSLIEIETPGANGVLDRGPSPIEDTGEPFVGVQGFSFDGDDSYAFTGRTLLSFNPFNRDFARETELTGRSYTLGETVSATGVIEGIVPPPPTVSFNTQISDPPDLSRGTQPTSWSMQRSQIQEIVLDLGFPIEGIPGDAITLTNLGVTDDDVDVEVPLTAEQMELSPAGQQIIIRPDVELMTAGRYQIDVSSQITFGEDFTLVGDSSNRFFVLPGDFDGNNSVDLRDLDTLAYWMGEPTAPNYVNLDSIGSITTQDAAVVEANFAGQIDLPGSNPEAAEYLDTDRLARALETLGHRTDVNGTGAVTPLDALNAINRIARGTVELNDWRFDVNRDGGVTPRDALLVINELSEIFSGQGSGGGGEGEPVGTLFTSDTSAIDSALGAFDEEGDFGSLF
ncbi:MAG: dockerin type I domain-containing protein [Planctomycetota bacterium]